MLEIFHDGRLREQIVYDSGFRLLERCTFSGFWERLTDPGDGTVRVDSGDGERRYSVVDSPQHTEYRTADGTLYRASWDRRGRLEELASAGARR